MFARLRAQRAAARGQASERQAEGLLTAAGLRLLDRNWRARSGELDLVMADGDTLVIVEVRARQYGEFGGALGSISREKQRRLLLTASTWLQQHPEWQRAPLRFDVVAFEEDGAPEWVAAAFDAGASF